MSKIPFILLIVLTLSSCLRTPDPEQSFLSEIYFAELSNRVHELSVENMDNNWLYIIDFGDQADFESGHIPFAENIEQKYFVDANGTIVNRGKAITERYENNWPFVVYSSSNDTIAYWIASVIQALGYSKVYFYSGSVNDWQEQGDYLLTSYSAFKTWHQENYPFEDTLQALVDVHPPTWYTGREKLEGHIPGALNIPVEELAIRNAGNITLINQGAALTDLIPDREAKIIVYHAVNEEQKALDFLSAARELNYTRLFLFSNGYDEWVSHGDSLVVSE